MQPGPENVVIGILGVYCKDLSLRRNPESSLALQGAFAEHQVMLKKLSLKQKIHVVLVRSEEDLSKCDALIIPGGGEWHAF